MNVPSSGTDWSSEAHRLFGQESDRGAALVVSAMLEVALEQLLEARLVAPTSMKRDILKSGAQAPLGTFSAKIDAAHQLGLISQYFARDLHFVRKIRNEFAHHPLDLSFESPPVVDWVGVLDSNARHSDTRPTIGPPGPRWDFLGVTSWMLYHLQEEVQGIDRLESVVPEFGYIRFEDLPSKFQKLIKDAEAEGSKRDSVDG